MMTEVGKEYKTTFSERVEVRLPTYISVNYLRAVAKTIAHRLSVNESLLIFSFKTEIGVNFETSDPDAMTLILMDASKYGRNVKEIGIKSEIIHKNKTSDTHYSVSFTLVRYNSHFNGSMYVYAVAIDVADSQHVIDWGSGLLNDFTKMNLDQVEFTKDDFLIDAANGSVRKWDKDDKVQKVEIVNDRPQKWSDIPNIITIGSIVIAIIIALITWAYFSNKGS